MLTLSKKLRRESESSEANNNNQDAGGGVSGGGGGVAQKKVSIRDKLLVKEFQELDGGVLPPSCELSLVEEDRLCEFDLTIRPDEGYWAGGSFAFHVQVPEDYNFSPPRVVCVTRIWHPNITEDGAVCLSLLRESSIDEMGWAPTRTLKDVVWGLNSLFTDLLNFDDPLNALASEEYRRDKEKFRSHVREYIKLHCLNKRK